MLYTLRLAMPVGIALLLAACASSPLATDGVDRDLTASVARGEPERAAGSTVIWGGVIVTTENLADRTRIEMVSYPLDERTQRPLTDSQPGARFLAYVDGYLESAEFADGRRLSIRGTVSGTESGQIGEADYQYPVVDAEELHLWPRVTTGRERDSGFRFGIGIILSN